MSSQTDALQRATLGDQIADLLLNKICDDAMQPGDALPAETHLAAMYSVSRPVIREALMKLKSLGFIGMSSGRPPVVLTIDATLPSIFFERSVAMNLSDVQELLEVRRGLEVQSAILAARHADPAIGEQLGNMVEQMRKALSDHRFNVFIQLDMKLHLIIAAASRNRILQTLIESIREPMRKSISRGLDARDLEVELQRLHSIHLDIVNAIIRKDEDAAAKAMAWHFDHAIESILVKGAIEES